MSSSNRERWCGGLMTAVFSLAIGAGLLVPTLGFTGEDRKEQKKPRKNADLAEKEDERSREKVKVRWGRRRNESEADYDKRYDLLLKRVKKDKPDDTSGGPYQLWTVKSGSFIVRSDVSAEFTADTAMYMEMLHREYGEAYNKLLGGVPSKIREPIEVVVFKDRDTYTKAGGVEGSGGQFMTHIRFPDRGPHWPATHYRLMQFTAGIDDFAKWGKGVLKHEAAHMELRMRLGVVLDRRLRAFWPVDCPRWWDEGHASVFEYWEFDKTVEENFAEIPNRGRYAPVIRRIHGTDRWKDFHYIWTIDPQTWHKDMTSDQGFLNYAQAWSLAGYMMNEGNSGRADFRKIFNLSLRVGADRKVSSTGTTTRSWELAFPESEREAMEKNWNKWVASALSRDKRVPDEDYMLRRQGFKPDVVDRLVSYSQEERDKMRKEIKAEEEDRRKRVVVEK